MVTLFNCLGTPTPTKIYSWNPQSNLSLLQAVYFSKMGTRRFNIYNVIITPIRTINRTQFEQKAFCSYRFFLHMEKV